MIRLDELNGAPGYLIHNVETSEQVLVQTDWDYPGVAGSFGWNIRESQRETFGRKCEHHSTDGTVTCNTCGLTANTFISDAASYLDSHIGATADDPGYFS